MRVVLADAWVYYKQIQRLHTLFTIPKRPSKITLNIYAWMNVYCFLTNSLLSKYSLVISKYHHLCSTYAASFELNVRPEKVVQLSHFLVLASQV